VSIATYAQLKTAVASWVNRSDLTTTIPDFVTLAEARIRRDIRARDQLTDYTATLSSEAVALPADLLEIRHVKATVSGYPKKLEYVTEDIYNTQPDASYPVFYTVDGNTLKVQGGSECVVNYWAKYDAFSADADTNWLLTNSPDVYLFASLVEAYDFLSDDMRMNRSLQRYLDAASQFNANEKKALFSGSMRVRAA
jgi:hypothetical protein